MYLDDSNNKSPPLFKRKHRRGSGEGLGAEW
jgi:hypothetical protein